VTLCDLRDVLDWIEGEDKWIEIVVEGFDGGAGGQ
jgi:hypothetical protein